MKQIFDGTCALIDVADQTSRETVMRGPTSLDDLKISHSVVATDIYLPGSEASTRAYVITTEQVPPVE